MANAEEEKKKQSQKFGGAPEEKDFSLPTKPKTDVKAGTSSTMMKEKVIMDVFAYQQISSNAVSTCRG